MIPMRVLMINRRSMRESPGGDVIQMEKTRDSLRKIGVQVDVIAADQLPARAHYDLVHLFNLQTPEDTMIGLKWAEHQGIPVVLSPIFWFMFENHFFRAVSSRRRWHFIAKILGTRVSWPLYKTWQITKSPFNQLWRNQRSLLRRSRFILPNARVESELIRNYFWLNGSWLRKVRVVPNAVDRALFSGVKMNSPLVKKYDLEGYVLQVAWIGEAKNQLGLISALYDIPVQIAFVGYASPHEPAYFKTCKDLAEKRGNVVFLGRLSYKELPAVYASAAVHVLPSWRETPGLASLEAGAAGCRVVSTSIGSAREYFGAEAWYCHPADHNSIQEAVVSALNTLHSNTLRKKILQHYTWENAAKATLVAYKAALQSE